MERGIALASLRGNGVQDMIDLDNTFGYLEIRLSTVGSTGSGTGAFGTKVQYSVPAVDDSDVCPNGVTTGDFNENGKLDIAVGDECGDMLYMYFGNGDGTVSSTPSLSYNLGSVDTIATGDFNADGPDPPTSPTQSIACARARSVSAAQQATPAPCWPLRQKPHRIRAIGRMPPSLRTKLAKAALPPS